MPWLRTFNELLSAILKVALIIVIFIAVFWGATSIYANITENNADTGLPDFPKVSKAQYLVVIKATGKVLLSNDVETALGRRGQEVHTLHGYYEDKDGKYRLNKADFVLDEWYWGDVLIIRRTE